MIGAIARKLFGSSNERRIKGYLPRVAQINALEKELEGLSDEALRARTEAFKRQVAEGASLDDILVPAFATCRLNPSVRARNASSDRPSSSFSRALICATRGRYPLIRRSFEEPNSLRAITPIMRYVLRVSGASAAPYQIRGGRNATEETDLVAATCAGPSGPRNAENAALFERSSCKRGRLAAGWAAFVER